MGFIPVDIYTTTKEYKKVPEGLKKNLKNYRNCFT